MFLKIIQRIYPKDFLNSQIKCLTQPIIFIVILLINQANAQNLILQDMIITTTETFSASNSITAGPNFTIANSGDVILTAPAVTLKPAFFIIEGGKLRVVSQTVAVEVKLENLSIPTEFVINQNYPNPFNPSTKITWQSPVSGYHVLKVFDILGREVKILVDEQKEVGYHSIEFDASDLPSGIYFYRLLVLVLQSQDGKTDSFVETKKMILLR